MLILLVTFCVHTSLIFLIFWEFALKPSNYCCNQTGPPTGFWNSLLELEDPYVKAPKVLLSQLRHLSPLWDEKTASLFSWLRFRVKLSCLPREKIKRNVIRGVLVLTHSWTCLHSLPSHLSTAGCHLWKLESGFFLIVTVFSVLLMFC